MHRSLLAVAAGMLVLAHVASACVGDGGEGGDLNPQPLPPEHGDKSAESPTSGGSSSSSGSNGASPTVNDAGTAADAGSDAGDGGDAQ